MKATHPPLLALGQHPPTTLRAGIGAWLVLCALLWCGVCHDADAAGFYLPGRGVHPMSRGGASIAGGDTLQTLWYNPANLIEMTGFHSLVDVGTIFTLIRYQRASRKGEDGKDINYEPSVNQGPPLPDPSLLFAYGWKPQKITIGFGLYAPYGPSIQFSDTGAQRYALVDMSGSLFLITQFSLAWAPHPRFRLGASLQNYTITVRLLSAASSYIGVFGGPEDRDLDLYSEARLSSWINPSGNIGLWGRALDHDAIKIDVAMSVQLPVFAHATGDLYTRLPTHPLFDNATVSGRAVETDVAFPWILRAAVRAIIPKRADLEVAFVYEMWSVLKDLTLTPSGDGIWIKNVPTIGDYKVPPIIIPRDFRDAFSIRIGGSVRLATWSNMELKLQLGYAFETSAIPDHTFNVFLVDSNKHLIGAGLSFTFGKHTIDLAYGVILQPTREINKQNCGETDPSTNETIRCIRQINPLNPEGAILIGDGTYESSYHTIGLSWRAAW